MTADQYNSLVASYRNVPGDHKTASRAAGIHVAQARRVWERGAPKQEMRPIRAMVVEEAAAARRLLLAHAEAEQRRAKGGLTEEGTVTVEEERRLAAKQRAREARLAQVAQGNAIGVLSIVNNLLTGCIALSQRVADELKSSTMTPVQFIATARRIAEIQKWATDSGLKSLEIERVRLGLPTATIGINVTATTERALESVRHVNSVIARAKALGLILPDGNPAGSKGPGDVPPAGKASN